MSARPTLLILSFTEFVNDARVKKQALMFAEHYDVVTCGYGKAVREDIEHIRLDPAVSTFSKYREAVFVRLRMYAAAFAGDERCKNAIAKLRGRRFDAVLANELETLPVAYSMVGPSKVLLDLHEYYPGLHDDIPVWVKVRQPYQEWVLSNQATRAAAATTVSGTIAKCYRERFGIDCGVVHNAAPYRADLAPAPVGDPIRLVHAGVTARNRRPEVMMDAVAQSSTNVTLDLYLTQQETPFGRELQARAAQLGERVTLHPPVPHDELIDILHRYDAGLHILPPTNTNIRLALPNKFFDSVQARLGMVIGPTVDMERLLQEYDLGVAAAGFDVADIVAVLDKLERGEVARWKSNAHAGAKELSSEAQQAGWLDAVRGLLG
ncbi:glycosyltransferase family 1 protein [Salinibacterium sp. SWN139]|uniref:glycosyltransferase family 1 protein n=1 Tax=Salinibacterium sp. SWN139 TaxID=2792055 RepID=UPI0018CFC6F6|nr:glycosyltransferase family 1 protein [Salinibacterium sp. SWN139]MBH0053571.1 glycosyltransferase family 1 protein [Salinibacterium sp. SWN139]